MNRASDRARRAWTGFILFAVLAVYTPAGAVGCHGEAPAVQSAPIEFDAESEAVRGTIEPVGPIVNGWDEQFDGIVCHHSPVFANCSGGWCMIPAGCFLMGSPETEFGRGMYTERLATVTLTHSFEIGQYETTQRQWTELVANNPSRSDTDVSECLEPECPVGHVSWLDAVEFANRLSAHHVPSFSPCYTMQGCKAEVGNGLDCENVTINALTIYDCEGYRLPTEAEWEYAARAGTRTAYYSGEMTVTVHGVPDKNLEDIAWYQPNAGKQTHPVGRKAPNRWMLYDVLGNADEWIHDSPIFHDPPGPLTDPSPFEPALIGGDATRVTKGGRADFWPRFLRVAGRDYPSWNTAGQGFSFRLARTLK